MYEGWIDRREYYTEYKGLYKNKGIDYILDIY